MKIFEEEKKNNNKKAKFYLGYTGDNKIMHSMYVPSVFSSKGR